jgi:hypothetical protein
MVIIAIGQYLMANHEVSLVRSDIDQQYYVVLDLPDKMLAANQLAALRKKLKSFISLRDPHHPGVKRVHSRFTVLSESKPGTRYTSYTVNKGSVHMCIRERDEGGRLIDDNTLFFVALHELAHIMTLSNGHTREFWGNFKYLLNHAIKDGYYEYHPYHQDPKKYCGTYISDTPLKPLKAIKAIKYQASRASSP